MRALVSWLGAGSVAVTVAMTRGSADMDLL